MAAGGNYTPQTLQKGQKMPNASVNYSGANQPEPLFIDTKLATCQPRTVGPQSDCGVRMVYDRVSPGQSQQSRGGNSAGAAGGSGLSQSWGKGGRSPLAQMMDRIKATHNGGRQRSISTSADIYGAPSSDFAKMNISPTTPSSAGDRLLPLPVSQHKLSVPSPLAGLSPGTNSAHLRLMPQHSLDSFLSTTAPLGSAGSSAIIYKTDSQQFIFGNDVAALAMSNLENENLVYSEFMRVHKCYDLIPTSSKLVVFDTELLVKKAFFALVYNGVRAAPLWDNETQQYVGMLTITDFISILRKQYNSPGGVQFDIEEQKIRTWKGYDNTNFTETKPHFFSIDVNESLYNAVKMLCDKRVHRLPVTNAQTGNVLYILTHKRILRFLFLYMYDLPKPKWMDKSPRELGIGTWSSISQVKSDTHLINALNLFIEKRISALPVVNEKDELVNIYAKFDVINIAAEKAYNNLDITVKDAVKHRSEWFEGVSHCLITDSLWTVMETLVKAEVHRMIITDRAKRVAGIVSLSDLLNYLVIKHATEHSSKAAQEEAEKMEWS